MLKMAFCDDELATLRTICALMDEYRVDKNEEMEYITFHNPLDLLSVIEKGFRFDVLFLDILMPGVNGIETAREIRQYDENVKIVFLTSSSEFALNSYSVNAYFYLLKPLTEESLYRLMDSIMNQCVREQKNRFVLKCKSGITQVNCSQIEYCEVIGKTLLLHFANGKVLECNKSLEELQKQLTEYECFIRPHRSYLINMDYIQNISYQAITMNCHATFPIPRGKYSELKDKFLKYAFQKKQVML